jgi:uncharacterized protein
MRVTPPAPADAVPPGVASPCVGLCRIDLASQWCEGCFRTLDEIAAWSRLDDDSKRQIIALLPLRQDAIFDPGQAGD